ncbi:hypothetical protein TNCV_1285151 [Trichonephila clavipes]|uniref:Uncharacterized protein n=1 Tax=Trichonephila clavipes TaxID=2585209 RepID=A0A8X6SR28_TRICX|nr:hypothetical protein TNCV_1285151 [Trichonephila clavipes]
MPTFGSSDLASSVPEGGITVIRHYPEKLREFLLIPISKYFSLPRKRPGKPFLLPKNFKTSLCHAPRLLGKAPVTACEADSRPELSGKAVANFQIGHQIQIAHLKIRQGSSVPASRLLRITKKSGGAVLGHTAVGFHVKRLC